MNTLFKISLSLVLLFTVGCVEDSNDGPLESQQTFVERLDDPIFLLFDEEGGISTEFGYSADEGWKWIDHRNDEFSPMPDLGVAYFFAPKALGFKAKAPEGQSFPTSSIGGTAYSASTIPRGFGASTPASTEFGLVPFSDVFSADVTSGQCSLTKLCDVALAICETTNTDCSGIDRCYAEIYRIELPEEFKSAYFCWVLDLIECVYRHGPDACGVPR